MEEKILGLYACGMSQRDISEQIKSLYDVDISPDRSLGRQPNDDPMATTLPEPVSFVRRNLK